MKIFCLFFFMFAAYANTPSQKMVPVTHVFVPSGFDANDNVEVVIQGFLPNLCHRAPTAHVKVQGQKIEIMMSSLVYKLKSESCGQMIVPFTETVSLGVLGKGEFHMVINSNSPWEKNESLQITEAKSDSIDEFSYAYVTYIEKESAPTGHVLLRGYNPSDCYVLDNITYQHNGKDTYSVLPKMKQIRDLCPMKMVPFEYLWKVPEDLNRNEVLLHVRTMNGKSVNDLYYRQ